MYLNETTIRQQEFCSPHKWCDNRCQRCPICDCPVRLGAIRQDWGAQMRAEAPQTRALLIEDVLRDFLRVMHGIANGGDRTSVDQERQELRCQTSRRSMRGLAEATCRFFAAVLDGRKASATTGVRTARECDEVLPLASLLRIKAAGLTAYGNDVGWELEALPNLLLMDTTARDLEEPLQLLREEVPSEIWERVNAAYQELRHAVSEELKGAETAQELLARMIGQRRAPSPFCTV